MNKTEKILCSIKCCKNSHGIVDQNIIFFRTPAEGTELRDKWMMILSSSADEESSYEYLDYLCQLHFKPDDFHMEMHNDEPVYKLNANAVPLPIENSIIDDFPIDEDMQDMKFVDINQFLNVPCDAKIKSEIIVDNENPASESNSCVKCTQYDRELQRANTKITTLETEIQILKMKIRNLQNPRKIAPKVAVNVPKNALVVKRTTIEQSTCRKCLLCYKQLDDHEMDKHLCLEHRKYIQCTYCLMAFLTTNDLLNHIAVHGVVLATDRKQKFYECEKCSITYSMKILLECHRMAHVMGNDPTGIPTNKKFESLAIIKTRKTNKPKNVSTTHAGPSSAPSRAYNSNLVTNLSNVLQKFFKCGKCQESFETGQLLQQHLRTHEPAPIPDYVAEKQSKGNEESTDETPSRIEYECYLCNCNYKRLTTMRKHMFSHVKSQKAVFHYCSICRAKVERTKMNSHVCGQLDNIQCEYCSKRFTGTNKLLKHLDVMHKTKRRLYECEKCSKYFPMIFLRDSHQNTHANETEGSLRSANRAKILDSDREKNHLCEECGRAFGSVRSLELHKQSRAHSEPSVECPDCDRKFQTIRNLQRHSQLHRKEQIIMVCDLCGKEGFNSVMGLKNHKKRHNRTDADRKYACKLCPLKFFLPKHLKKHEIKHTGIKQFHCQHCDSSYKYQSDLLKHFRTHFPDDKIYGCSMCPERFKYSNELQKHSFEHYKNEKSKNQILEKQATGEKN